MDLRAIREAVAERLSTVDGVRAWAWPADQIATGQAIGVAVTAGDPYVDYLTSFGPARTEQVNLIVTPHVPYVDPRSAWNTLDALTSTGSATTRSIVDALMVVTATQDRTLGGVCSDIVVDTVQAPQVLSVESGARYLTADIPVRIIAKRVA